jgi:hypothetical protein
MSFSLLTGLALGCGDNQSSHETTPGIDDGIEGGSEAGSGAAASGAGETNQTGSGGDGDGDGDGDETCASVSTSTSFIEVPADIIFVVDNSGSMSEEAEFVQDQMNGFSAQIEQSGVDAHVVLISSYPDHGNGICIDPPLGSGGCPDEDENLDDFRHVDVIVGSHDALLRLISTQPDWQPSIRPDSVKHIVVVSDDESNLSVGMFDQAFTALDPSYAGYVFHAIVCQWDCPESADIGQVYIDLAAQTGGVLGDLCGQEFQSVFDELAAAVIEGTPVACALALPEPPPGLELDPDAVVVEIDDGQGNVESIPRLAGPSDCEDHPSGWYYDDPDQPEQIVLCPQTCAQAQGYTLGAVNVAFACNSLVP